MPAIMVIFGTGRNWGYLRCPVTGALLRELRLQNTREQRRRGGGTGREPLTLMKHVFPEAGFHLSLCPSIRSAS